MSDIKILTVSSEEIDKILREAILTWNTKLINAAFRIPATLFEPMPETPDTDNTDAGDYNPMEGDSPLENCIRAWHIKKEIVEFEKVIADEDLSSSST